MGLPSSEQNRAGGKCSPPACPLQLPAQTAAAVAACPPRTSPGLYLHIPFCFHKCHYCDFYSIVDDRDRQKAFTQRLIDEIRSVALASGQPALSTIFAGGGTPTLLPAPLWQDLLQALHQAFDLSQLAEFTVEANPETLTPELLDVLVGGSVNRLSIGCQSFNPTHLKTLERWHEPANVLRSVALAKAAGITNFNLDLIYAIPGQTMTDWLDDLHRAFALHPTHLSCYALTYEPNTPMTVKLAQGRIDRTDESLEAQMFHATIDTLAAAGYAQYEISNFSLTPAHRCQHNLNYWLNGDWLAIGPSASGHIQGLRWKNTPHLGRYLASSGGAPIDADSIEKLDPEQSIGEQLMLRLRLIDGAPLDWCEKVLSRKRLQTIAHLIDSGQLERTTTHLRLTRPGLLVADSVIAELL